MCVLRARTIAWIDTTVIKPVVEAAQDAATFLDLCHNVIHVGSDHAAQPARRTIIGQSEKRRFITCRAVTLGFLQQEKYVLKDGGDWQDAEYWDEHNVQPELSLACAREMDSICQDRTCYTQELEIREARSCGRVKHWNVPTSR